MLAGVAVGASIWLNPRFLVTSSGLTAWYQALAALSGGLLALGTIVITLLFTVTPSDRLQAVLNRVGKRLSRLVVRSLSGLILTTTGFCFMLLLDAHANRVFRIGLTAGLLTFGALRFLRLWWLLDRILRVLMTERSHVSTPIPPSSRWTRPEVTPDHYRLQRRPRETKR